MRTYVSKMLVGPVGSAAIAVGEVAAAPWADIVALLAAGTALPAAAGSDEFGIVKRTEDVEGNPAYVTAGPFDTDKSEANDNQYKAPVAQVVTATLDVTGLVDGDVIMVRVAYHDNLSIIPNQIKFTLASVVYKSGMDIAQAVTDAFNAQEFIFVNVAKASATTVTFTSKILTGASQYNHINRPEVIFFEVAGDVKGDNAVLTAALTTPGVVPQGTAAQIAWMEEQHMGRRGYSDRISWNDGKKYPVQADPAKTYDVLVITANKIVEGDMQDNRSNPVGAVVASEDTAALVTALGTIGVTAVTVA